MLITSFAVLFASVALVPSTRFAEHPEVPDHCERVERTAVCVYREHADVARPLVDEAARMVRELRAAGYGFLVPSAYPLTMTVRSAGWQNAAARAATMMLS